jgi:hypothetical protein
MMRHFKANPSFGKSSYVPDIKEVVCFNTKNEAVDDISFEMRWLRYKIGPKMGKIRHFEESHFISRRDGRRRHGMWRVGWVEARRVPEIDGPHARA